MKTKLAPTIRSKLVLLVMACVVPAALMAVLLIAHDYERARQQLLNNSLSTARAMISVVDRDFASIESSLISLASSPYLVSNNLHAFYDQAQDVLRNQRDKGGINIVLSDNHGQQYLNTRQTFGSALPPHTEIIRLDEVDKKAEPIISDLFFGTVSGHNLFAITVPVPVPGKANLRYSLSAGVLPERLNKLLQQQKIPEGWIAAIFDSTGTIVARTGDKQHLIGKKGVPEIVQRMHDNEEGIFESVTYDGLQVQTVFSRSKLSNWSLAIGIPTQSIIHELRSTLFLLIFATILLLASSLTAAWLIGGRIAKSVNGLTGPALALGAGRLVSVPPLHLREADEVGSSLARASEMLHQAQHQANHDALTGLANRALFHEIVSQQLTLCERNKTLLSILYIDLDGFKAVNDQHGHDSGDRLLRAVASRLKSNSRHSDVVARLGGDEFAMVMVGARMEDARYVAEKLVEAISAPYLLDDTLTSHISASIGVATYPESGTTSEALLHRADGAMYKAKNLGRRQVALATTN
ncbi:putative diguanylate cyclase YegE [compost metagenome]